MKEDHLVEIRGGIVAKCAGLAAFCSSVNPFGPDVLVIKRSTKDARIN